MKKIIFLIFTLAAISMIFAQKAVDLEEHLMATLKDAPAKEIFKAFHFVHEKNYELNSQEGLQRYRNFKATLKWIKENNEKRGEQVYGITQFADMTLEEYKEKHLVKNMEEQIHMRRERFLHEENHHDHHDHHDHDDKHHHHNHGHGTHDHHDDEHHGHHNGHHGHRHPDVKKENLKATLPDWRKFDGPIKNQASCGSCWSFSAIGVLENFYNQLKGKYTAFSEQYLVDCDTSNNGCNGGWMGSAYTFIQNNGILNQEAYPYKTMKQVCETKWETYQYKIVKGQRAFYEGYSNQYTWDQLMAMGPVAVAIDAATNEFRNYRPGDNLAVLESNSCSSINHAVIASAIVEENGRQYIIGRNSWGTNWGAKGWYKIPKDNNCFQTKYGFQPVVYDGHVPSTNPPKPEPVPTDCVKVYGSGGFSYAPKMEVCDSKPDFGGTAIMGVKFPEVQNSKIPLSLRLFYYTKCYGKGHDYDKYIPIEESTEFPKYEGVQQWSSSLAYHKPAQPGCISFYSEYCLGGMPKFSLCNSVHDSDGVNLDDLNAVKSFVVDNLQISNVIFYSEANYQGHATDIGNVTYYQLRWRLTNMFQTQNAVRSIKIV